MKTNPFLRRIYLKMLSDRQDTLPTVHISFEKDIIAFMEKYQALDKKCLKEKK